MYEKTQRKNKNEQRSEDRGRERGKKKLQITLSTHIYTHTFYVISFIVNRASLVQFAQFFLNGKMCYMNCKFFFFLSSSSF